MELKEEVLFEAYSRPGFYLFLQILIFPNAFNVQLSPSDPYELFAKTLKTMKTTI